MDTVICVCEEQQETSCPASQCVISEDLILGASDALNVAHYCMKKFWFIY